MEGWKNRKKPQRSPFFGPLLPDFDWIFIGIPSGKSWDHFETIGAGFDWDTAQGVLEIYRWRRTSFQCLQILNRLKPELRLPRFSKFTTRGSFWRWDYSATRAASLFSVSSSFVCVMKPLWIAAALFLQDFSFHDMLVWGFFWHK